MGDVNKVRNLDQYLDNSTLNDRYAELTDPGYVKSSPTEAYTEKVVTEVITLDLPTWVAAQDLMGVLGIHTLDELVHILIRRPRWALPRFAMLSVDIPVKD